MTVKLRKNQSKQTTFRNKHVFPSPNMLQDTAVIIWEHSSCPTAMSPFKQLDDDLHGPWKVGSIAPPARREGHICFITFRGVS